MNRIDLRHLCAAPVLAAGCSRPRRRSPPTAATNGPNGTFEAWLARFKAEAVKQGISRNAIAAAAPYLVYDQRIVNIDHGQRIFAQSFLEFSGKMLPAYRLQQGAAEIKKYAAGLRPRREAVRRAGRRSSSGSGGSKAISAPTWARTTRSNR